MKQRPVRRQNFSRPPVPVPVRPLPGGHYTVISTTLAPAAWNHPAAIPAGTAERDPVGVARVPRSQSVSSLLMGLQPRALIRRCGLPSSVPGAVSALHHLAISDSGVHAAPCEANGYGVLSGTAPLCGTQVWGFFMFLQSCGLVASISISKEKIGRNCS